MDMSNKNLPLQKESFLLNWVDNRVVQARHGGSFAETSMGHRTLEPPCGYPKVDFFSRR